MKSLLKFSFVALLALGLAACGSDSSGGAKDTVDNSDVPFGGYDTTPDDDTLVDQDTLDDQDLGSTDDDSSCVPDCAGKDCGGNGCGGSCGTCDNDQTCNGGVCEDNTPEELDCKGLLLCYSQCETTDQPCYEACYNSAPEAVKAQDDALQGCMAENGWNDCANDECKDEILGVLCKDEYDSCIPPGTLSCKEINDCINSCPEETFQECASDCISDGSTEGQDQYGAFADCAIGNGFNDCASAQCQNDVIQDFCATEYDTCNEATGTCSDLWDCVGACDAEDSSCMDNCDANTTIKGISDYNAFVDCIIEACDNPPTQECFDGAKAGACQAMYADCFNAL
jgi:hypothetical protein